MTEYIVSPDEKKKKELNTFIKRILINYNIKF